MSFKTGKMSNTQANVMCVIATKATTPNHLLGANLPVQNSQSLQRTFRRHTMASGKRSDIPAKIVCGCSKCQRATSHVWVGYKLLEEHGMCLILDCERCKHRVYMKAMEDKKDVN
jgi:hypothetical protein